jgi:hypothetical protein
MFTRGIIQDGIKYVEYMRDLNDIRFKSLEDFLYCILVEIEINVNDETCAVQAENYMNRLTNNIKFPRNEDFTYAKILNNKSFLTEFIEWFKLIDASCFDFETIPVYDISVDLKNYIRFDKWIFQLNILKEKLVKRCINLEQM